VALHVAHKRPDCIASLALYEPSAFHLLKQVEHGADPLADILAITHEAGIHVTAGDYRAAAAAFMDYWARKGAWEALPPEVQRSLTRWALKAPLDFRALLEEPTPLAAYAGLRMPALVMRGEHAPKPTFTIAVTLSAVMADACLAVVEGAGHMGPMTHAAVVSDLIAAHIRTVEGTVRRSCAERPQPTAIAEPGNGRLAGAVS
jgi:pimeloyl-ACP methyl ester carboxylesterase